MNQLRSDCALPHEIIANLRFCGHFLHFKMGEKAGRRRVFSVLLQHHEIAQRDLQNILGVSSGSLSEILAKTEADGLIERQKSLTDKRHYTLKLTPAGNTQAIEMQTVYEERVKEMLNCFSGEQQLQLQTLLETLATHWIELEEQFDSSSVPPLHCREPQINDQ